jgi:hypothetical protein
MICRLTRRVMSRQGLIDMAWFVLLASPLYNAVRTE